MPDIERLKKAIQNHPEYVAPNDVTTDDIWVVLTHDERKRVVRQALTPDAIWEVLTKDERKRIARAVTAIERPRPA